MIVKTGADLRQEQLAVQLIQEFRRIWKEENCQCWARQYASLTFINNPLPVGLTCFLSFRILITGGNSGLVETITDAVSIHSIKKAEYARRSAGERLGHVTLMDHFKNVCSRPISGLLLIHSILLDLWGSFICKICPCPAKLCEIASRVLRNHLSPPDQRPP